MRPSPGGKEPKYVLKNRIIMFPLPHCYWKKYHLGEEYTSWQIISGISVTNTVHSVQCTSAGEEYTATSWLIISGISVTNTVHSVH